MNRARTITLALCALFVLLWSSGFIGGVFALGYAGVFTMLFWRYLLLALVLAALCASFRAWRRMRAREFFRHALVGVLAHAVWLIAVLTANDLGVSAGIAAFITALQPMVTAALAARIIGEQVTPKQWCGIALGLAAVGVVVADKIAVGGSPLAYFLPFAAVFAVSFAVVIDRGARGESEPPVLLTTLIHACASLIVIAPFAWLAEDFALQLGVEIVFAVLWLALVVSLGA